MLGLGGVILIFVGFGLGWVVGWFVDWMDEFNCLLS